MDAEPIWKRTAKNLFLVLGVLFGIAVGVGYFFHVNLLEWLAGRLATWFGSLVGSA